MTDAEKLTQAIALLIELRDGPSQPSPLGPVIRGQTIIGTNKDDTLLTLEPHTLVEDCVLTGSPQGQKRGIRVEVPGCTIRRTTITNIWHNSDSQCISGDNATRDLLIDGCDLQASGENIIFGGGDPTSEANIPQGITIRSCMIRKPLAWRTLDNCTNKNLFELKNAKQVLLENCVMEYSWRDGQAGFAIVLSVRNQDNTAPYSTIEDVIIRNTTVRHCAGGIQILGRDYTNPSQTMKRVTFENVTVEDIDSVQWGTDENGHPTNGRILQLMNGSEDVKFIGCDFHGVNLNSMLLFGGTNLATDIHKRLVVQNCWFDSGEYSIRGDDPAGGGNSTSGVAALELWAPGYTWSNVTVRKSPNAQPTVWPSGTTLV